MQPGVASFRTKGLVQHEAIEAERDISHSKDPFRAVRYVIYSIFSLVGLAGLGVSFSQMSSTTGNAIGNIVDIVVNGVVLAAGAGAFFVDPKVQHGIEDEMIKDPKNPLATSVVVIFLAIEYMLTFARSAAGSQSHAKQKSEASSEQ